MSATQTPTENDRSDTLRCTRCHAVLPRSATFCGQCGERVRKQEYQASSPDYSDIIERYRITSLVRRRPYSQLFFAFDNQQQQIVAIHAINISTLQAQERARAIEAFQYQYDLLRRQSLPTIMRLVDLRYFREHLYLIATWPKQDPRQRTQHLSTLFSLLQSGIGLPDEQVAIAWIYRLSRTLEFLHKNAIVAGNLDPDTILVNEVNFEGDSTLMVSWLPPLLLPLLPHPSIDTNTAYFYAPEALIGEAEPRSDVYSLGAILYLLLSGVTPKDAIGRTHEPLASLREINPRINSTIDAVVMRALALNKEERYQSAGDFSEALLQLSNNPHHLRTIQRTSSHSTPVDTTRQDLALSVQPDEEPPHNQEEMRISSSTVDNTSDTTVSNQRTEALEDAPTSIVPLQAQMARRYLSKIKTGKADKAEIQEKQNGEEPVEEGLLHKEADGGEETVDSRTKTYTGYSVTEEHPSSADQNGGGDKPTPEKIAVQEIETNPVRIQTEKTHLLQEVDIQNTNTVIVAPDKSGGEQQEQMGDTTHEIEQLDTVPFVYQKLEVPDTSGQQRDQEKEGRPQETASRALQVRGPTSLQRQATDDREPISERLKALFIKTTTTLPEIIRLRELATANRAVFKQLTASPKEGSILKQVQHFLLGEPQNSTKAAALIETPLRIQPGQNYSIRINVIGRNEPTEAHTAGLSALKQGEKVHIEVRSALYQNYAYIVQQADIQMPTEGYVAEVTMPMQPLSGGPSGRRERLHIFFMDDANNPLYEKPFVIEIFISHLVQSGREGHNVLSIPL